MSTNQQENDDVMYLMMDSNHHGDVHHQNACVECQKPYGYTVRPSVRIPTRDRWFALRLIIYNKGG